MRKWPRSKRQRSRRSTATASRIANSPWRCRHRRRASSFSYLWHDEYAGGAQEGRKNRPCAILLVATDNQGDTIVYAVPTTHSRPQDVHAVAIPAPVKHRLGLDDAPSWIVTSELNCFVWPGYDLRPVSRERADTFAWGFLSTEIFAAVKRGVAANRTAGRLKVAQRAIPDAGEHLPDGPRR